MEHGLNVVGLKRWILQDLLILLQEVLLKPADEIFAADICRRVPAAFKNGNLHSNTDDAPSVQMDTLFFVH